jgi:Zn-dependent protease
MSDATPEDAPVHWDRQTWSLGVGPVLGSWVRFHLSTFVFLTALALSWLGWPGMLLALAWFVALAAHEAGHVLTGWALGSDQEDLVIWPVGSLRTRSVSGRPIETTLILFGGGAVNLTICLMLLPTLFFLGHLDEEIWNPLEVVSVWHGVANPASWAGLLFKANYWLLLVNLLPLYPLDGGRMIRELAGVRLPSLHATAVAVLIGALGGVLLFSLALWFHYLWVALLGGFVVVACTRRYRQLEMFAENQENEFGYDFSEGYTSLDRSMTPLSGSGGRSLGRSISQWWSDRQRRQAESLEAELDRILAKIHDTGITSLSRTEKRILALASKRRRT